ncbi:hypothetical protein ACEWY4_002397 [Coilia grayii]|uniref:NIDO domain-containing protein n=1 Tax=Coilia grayii TaxID=363190 RepID=A0ABD1KNW5_9TELE
MMMNSLSLFLIMLALGVCSTAQGVFYPFGSAAGDTFIPHPNDGFTNITLLHPFPYFNRTHQDIHVSPNGGLWLGQLSSPNSDVIVPFSTLINYIERGNVSYQQYTTGDVLHTATRDISSYFPNVTFTASWVLVVTWDRVVYYELNDRVTNDQEATFQAVLISDGDLSFVLMNYGDISPPPRGALIGYSKNYFNEIVLLNDCYPNGTIDYVNLKTSSNINIPGRWAFPTSLESTFSCAYPLVPQPEHVVGVRLQVSSAERLNETAVEEQILKPLRHLLRQRGVDVSGIRLRRLVEKQP